MKTLKLALMGFGNCGQAFCEMLLQKHETINNMYDTDVRVTAIATRSKGNVINDNGIDLRRALDEVSETGHFMTDAVVADAVAADAAKGRDSLTIAKEADYDVLIEMTPLNIFTGEPATTHIREAFARGRHVITANKGPVARHYRELKDEAERKGVCFFYETVVMDGAPVFNLAEHTLKLAKVTEVSGILNSTTNFILEELAAGAEYDDIIARGRQMGFIEEDSAMDIEGYDAAGKITVLANVLMDAQLTPEMVDRKGIEDITVEDIRAAEAEGKVIKLMCRCYHEDGEDGTHGDACGPVKAYVRPEKIDKTDLLASVNSTTSVVSITTDLMKKISVVEHEPEIEQTAYGVFGDVIRVIEEM